MYRVASSSLRGAPCLLRRSFVYSAATSSSPTATSSLSSSADQKRPFWASNLSSSTTTTSTPFGSGDTAETSKVPPAAFRKSKKVAAAAAAEEEEEDGEDATETATGSSKRTTTDIANELAATHDFSKAKAKKIVDSVFDTIAANLQQKRTVSVSGFGTFKTSVSKATRRVNIHTKEPFEIPEKNRVKFSAFTALKESVQENYVPPPPKIKEDVAPAKM